MMVPRDEHLHRSSLMGDSPQEMTIQGTGRNRLRKWNPVNVQLPSQIIIDQGDISPRVNEGSQGVGSHR